MEKELKINVPEGYEIDKENSTFECIKFKPIGNGLPKTWEEFCLNYAVINEYFIDSTSKILQTVEPGRKRQCLTDRNLFSNKEMPEAMLALCQLIRLRDCYNNGWVPDWSGFDDKFVIYFCQDNIGKRCFTGSQEVLAFKTEELRDQFLENFRDLIETAKPLL